MSAEVKSTCPHIAGCHCEALDQLACERYLAWLLAEPGAAAPKAGIEAEWALAHCEDGVTWGRYHAKEEVWYLGNHATPEVSPLVRRDGLQELRLFGESAEVLIWRTDAGLRGRVLRDIDAVAERGDGSNPLCPSTESRILRGIATCDCREQKRECRAHDLGFTHVTDGTGAEQILPLEVAQEQLRAAPVRLTLRHYYEQEAKTGAVRIAATRLIKLTIGGTHGS